MLLTVASRRLAVGLVLIALVGLPACSSRHWSFRTPSPTILGISTADDGTRTVYELISTTSGTPRINETVRSTRQTAYLGIRTRQLTTSLAASLGVPAWNGVYLEKVVSGSAADLAGLRKGDILRFLNDISITAPEQVTEIISDELSPGQELMVKVQRWAPGEGDEDPAFGTREFLLLTGSRSVEQVITHAHKLKSSRGVRRHTGMTVGEVDAELARAVFKEDESLVLVTRVMPGSPAYLAGFRSGDRITSVDSEPAGTVDVVRRAVLLRAADQGYKIRKSEFEGSGEWLSSDVPEGRLQLSVEGSLGPLTRRVGLVEDVGDDLEFYFPILLSIESDTPHTKWSFLDFILQFGANYKSTYVSSRSRSSESVTDFSMLPFGMFEYSSSPDWSEWTFFWFITFTA